MVREETALSDWDYTQSWYHGSPLRLEILKVGSTITQDRELARIFSHKPQIVSFSDDGTRKHNGTQVGYLYRIVDELSPASVYPHPTSAMAPGLEWLTRRELRVELIGMTSVLADEKLTDVQIEQFRKLFTEKGKK